MKDTRVLSFLLPVTRGYAGPISSLRYEPGARRSSSSHSPLLINEREADVGIGFPKEILPITTPVSPKIRVVVCCKMALFQRPGSCPGVGRMSFRAKHGVAESGTNEFGVNKLLHRFPIQGGLSRQPLVNRINESRLTVKGRGYWSTAR